MQNMPVENHDIEDLLLRFFSGETDPEEERYILAWKNENAENRTRFNAMRDIWMLSTLNPKEEDSSVQTELLRLKHRIAEEPTEQKPVMTQLPKTGRRYHILRSISAAVLFVAAMGCGALLFYLADTKSRKTEAAVAGIIPYDTMRFEANRGSLASATLPDGTVIRLNAGSTISYCMDYGARSRQVKLLGEAYFEVVPNSDHPFRVEAKDLVIEATGTAFNVKSYPEEHFVVTTLESGGVSIRGVGRNGTPFSIDLKPRQVLMYYAETEQIGLPKPKSVETGILKQIESKDIPAVRITNVKTELYTSWKDGRWIVERERFGSLAEKLERRHNVTMTFLSPEAQDYLFTGAFENETIEEIMQFLRHAMPISYTLDKGHIQISTDPSRLKTFEKVIH